MSDISADRHNGIPYGWKEKYLEPNKIKNVTQNSYEMFLLFNEPVELFGQWVTFTKNIGDQ